MMNLRFHKSRKHFEHLSIKFFKEDSVGLSMRIRSAGHVVRMWEIRNSYIILVGKLKGGDHSEDLGV
jgi:hypothetical protein